jgi:hypothetical protein
MYVAVTAHVIELYSLDAELSRRQETLQGACSSRAKAKRRGPSCLAGEDAERGGQAGARVARVVGLQLQAVDIDQQAAPLHELLPIRA